MWDGGRHARRERASGAWAQRLSAGHRWKESEPDQGKTTHFVALEGSLHVRRTAWVRQGSKPSRPTRVVVPAPLPLCTSHPWRKHMDALRQDVRFAIRSFARRPAFAEWV